MHERYLDFSTILEYSHTRLKTLIICGVLELGLKQTEQRMRMALLCECLLSPWERGFKPVIYFRKLFFLKIPEQGRGDGVFMKCDKCFHK